MIYVPALLDSLKRVRFRLAFASTNPCQSRVGVSCRACRIDCHREMLKNRRGNSLLSLVDPYRIFQRWWRWFLLPRANPCNIVIVSCPFALKGWNYLSLGEIPSGQSQGQLRLLCSLTASALHWLFLDNQQARWQASPYQIIGLFVSVCADVIKQTRKQYMMDCVLVN